MFKLLMTVSGLKRGQTAKNPLERIWLDSVVKINVVRSYKKYWKFLPCGSTGWFNDVDKKTSKKDIG